MAGNVWEWTRSLYRSYPYNPTDGREDLQVPVDINRVVRGGSYIIGGRYVRCAYRNWYDPLNRYNNFGFRVVCVSPSHHASGL